MDKAVDKSPCNKYGNCADCGHPLAPIWFTDYEYRNSIKTGRWRNAISHLACTNCLKDYCIDDSMDEPWVG